MRYELGDHEWYVINPMLPNKPRGIPRVDDWRVLNGIFWVLRSGAPWRDLPETYGPRTTCYNRFVRWRRAGVWDQIMDALAAGHDAAVTLPSLPVRRTTIGCVRFFSAHCFRKRCCSRIVDTTRTGSGSSSACKAHGQTSHRNEIAKTRSASARICIVRGA